MTHLFQCELTVGKRKSPYPWMLTLRKGYYDDSFMVGMRRSVCSEIGWTLTRTMTTVWLTTLQQFKTTQNIARDMPIAHISQSQFKGWNTPLNRDRDRPPSIPNMSNSRRAIKLADTYMYYYVLNVLLRPQPLHLTVNGTIIITRYLKRRTTGSERSMST